MKSKGELNIEDIDSALLYIYYHKSGITKKEVYKFRSKAINEILQSLKRENPLLLKKLNSLTDDELINYFVEQRMISKKLLFPYEYYFLVWRNIYLNKFNDISNKQNQKEARTSFKNLNVNEFLSKLKKGRFKTPPDVEKFIEEIKLLKEKYPIILDKKLERKKLINKQKSWSRKAIKDSPISITHELFKELNLAKKITPKGLSLIRTKIKRAKRRGFL